MQAGREAAIEEPPLRLAASAPRKARAQHIEAGRRPARCAYTSASLASTPSGSPAGSSWRLGAAVAVLAFHLFPVYYTAVQAVRPLSEF
jgi:hypothetical protein